MPQEGEIVDEVYIHNGGSSLEAGNYRLVDSTSILWKMMELIIEARLSAFHIAFYIVPRTTWPLKNGSLINPFCSHDEVIRRLGRDRSVEMLDCKSSSR